MNLYLLEFVKWLGVGGLWTISFIVCGFTTSFVAALLLALFAKCVGCGNPDKEILLAMLLASFLTGGIGLTVGWTQHMIRDRNATTSGNDVRS